MRQQIHVSEHAEPLGGDWDNIERGLKKILDKILHPFQNRGCSRILSFSQTCPTLNVKDNKLST
jgi:hypothetical protein